MELSLNDFVLTVLFGSLMLVGLIGAVSRFLHWKNEGYGHEWFRGMDFHEGHSETQALATRRLKSSNVAALQRAADGVHAQSRCL